MTSRRAARADVGRPAVPAAAMPWTVRLYVALTWLLGWWMVIDGLHLLMWGDYIRLGGELGPWASLASALGIDVLDWELCESERPCVRIQRASYLLGTAPIRARLVHSGQLHSAMV